MVKLCLNGRGRGLRFISGGSSEASEGINAREAAAAAVERAGVTQKASSPPYTLALLATKTIEEIAEAKKQGQVVFQQLYIDETNDTATQELFDRTKEAGADAIVFTVDSPANGNRQRALRFGVGSTESSYNGYTWDYYNKLTNMTDLPIILKGIGTVEDAKLAIENNVPAIVLSNHGGRQVDVAQSSLETALEIHREAPEIFEQIEVYADGGVRYGSDVLKLLSLGVKAVGLGRPFMYSNVFGQEGVDKVIELLKYEIAIDAANIGLGDLKDISPKIVNWRTGGYGGPGRH